jgi:hypothetical protein
MLEILHPAGALFGVRAVNMRDTPDGFPYTLEGYFDSYSAALMWARNVFARAEGLYVLSNPLRPEVLARSANRLRKLGKGEGVSGRDIAARCWLTVDIDPVRLSGISATDAEHALALAVGAQVKRALTEAGWPAPLDVDSGNGRHLHYPVQMPLEDGGLCTRVLAALAARFDTEQVHIDTGTTLLTQGARLAGSWNQKGDMVADRRHRQVRILGEPMPPGGAA